LCQPILGRDNENKKGAPQARLSYAFHRQ